VATVIAAIVAIKRADVAFTCVFIWAYIAIAIRQVDNPTISITAVVSAVVLGILLILSKNKTVKSIAD
jgi:hydrogenase/urease accessory protein HupE